MKRIKCFTHKALNQAQLHNFTKARSALDNIAIETIAAGYRLDEIERIKTKGGVPGEDFGL